MNTWKFLLILVGSTAVIFIYRWLVYKLSPKFAKQIIKWRKKHGKN